MKQVVILSGLENPASNHSNIREIYHGVEIFDEESLDMFEQRSTETVFVAFKDYLPKLTREMYKVPEVQELYEKKNEFDVIMINSLFNEVKSLKYY